MFVEVANATTQILVAALFNRAYVHISFLADWASAVFPSPPAAAAGASGSKHDTVFIIGLQKSETLKKTQSLRNDASSATFSFTR